jgi:hypothetical protein
MMHGPANVKLLIGTGEYLKRMYKRREDVFKCLHVSVFFFQIIIFTLFIKGNAKSEYTN